MRSEDCSSSRILASSQNAKKLVPTQNVAFVKEVHDRLQPCFFRHIFKRSVWLLMVKAIPILRPRLLWDGPLRRGIVERRTIDSINIKTAVVVIVE